MLKNIQQCLFCLMFRLVVKEKKNYIYIYIYI